jgi:hypothetical protein
MKRPAKSAWLVYWQVMGDQYDVKDGDIVTVLSSRLGEEKVKAALELLFKQCAYTFDERLEYRQYESGPYKIINPLRAHGVPVGGLQYSIGTNPMLTVRKVKNVQIKDDKVIWDEESVAHPDWLCDLRKVSDCPLRGKPSVITRRSSVLPS